MEEVNIIVLVNETNKGDDANSLATGREIKKLFEDQQISVTEHITNADDVESFIHPNKRNIVVAAGEHHIKTLYALKQNPNVNGEVYTSWSGHQITETLLNKTGNIDSIALPKHALNEENHHQLSAKCTNLIETVGVAHNTQPEDLEKEYKKLKSHLIESDKYYMVMLGGDATDPTGKMQYYTPEEAHKLGKYIGEQAKKNNAVVLGLNGPRTGKYNPNTGEKLLTHKNGCDLDEVSEAFIAGLKESELNENTDFQFFDFKFDETKINTYQAVLGAVRAKPESHVYMPGDSTSMISEACDLSPSGSVTVFRNGAMNMTHHSHVNSVHAEGYTSVLSKNMEEERSLNQNNTESKSKPLSAAAVVAKRVFDAVCEKKSQTITPLQKPATAPSRQRIIRVSYFIPSFWSSGKGKKKGVSKKKKGVKR